MAGKALFIRSDIFKKSQWGLSLTEVIFAASILGLVMMVLFNLYPTAILSVKVAEHKLKAANLAQSILEEKKSGKFSDLYNPPPLTDVKGNDGVIYHPSYVAFDVPGANPANLKGIRATVTWKERIRDYSISQELYICKVQH